jgi:hypothetical protein
MAGKIIITSSGYDPQLSLHMSIAVPKQFELLPTLRPSSEGACQITAVGRRRDGRMRYWCLAHKSDATGKYGRRLDVCRGADFPPISQEETLALNLDRFAGGVALWGAVPPVYDTTRLPLDRGIHVHAREVAEGPKVHDNTFRAVSVTGGQSLGRRPYDLRSRCRLLHG